MPHWRKVFMSMMDAIHHDWKEERGEHIQKQVETAFELQDQSELDEIDHEFYTEGVGDG